MIYLQIKKTATAALR